MAISTVDATTYIDVNVIDIEDWDGADDAKKQRLINVASRTLTNQYPTYTIPDNAVYEFAAKLAIVFNDTNRLQNQGVVGLAIQGAVSMNFKAEAVIGLANNNDDLARYIPKAAYDIISTDPANVAANLPALGGRLKWGIL